MSGLNSALTPSRIIEYLNRYIVGQDKAKRAVAIALRNRLRRRALPPEMAHEIMPKNILMVGPTGVGKTEIARRLATLSDAPFIKVEATKFTEVGYVGRDVETIIRDLMEFGVAMVRRRMLETMQAPALERAEQRLLDAMLPKKERRFSVPDLMKAFGASQEEAAEEDREEEGQAEENTRTRARLLEMLRAGRLDDREVDVEVTDAVTAIPVMGASGMDSMGVNISEMLSGILPKRSRKRHMKVKEALRILQSEEAEKLIDKETLAREALEIVQEGGIVFLDELDKVVVRGGSTGPDVSREGVQRDLLPIVEGSVVQTRYGPVKTDHILFIAAGAFSISKPSDLIPEFQGRFPLRVELESLHAEDFKRILLEPKNALTKQYKALLETEGLTIIFKDEAIERMSNLAAEVNSTMENIGARRLHTIMEMLLEDISFNASDMTEKTVEIDRAYVDERLKNIVQDQDLSRYIL